MDQATIEKIVSLAVPQILTGIGFDMTEPTEIQADIRHLRRSREICESIQDNAIKVAVKIGIGIVAAALLAYFGINYAEALVK